MQSAIWGRKAGMFVVLGLATGILGHTMAVAIGLAAVFAASPMAFTALKLAGAATSGLADPARPVGPEQGQRPEPQKPAALYRRGIIMNLTNPKVLLFFFAFLPQFTSPALGPIGPQTVQLGAVFMLATLLVFGAIAFFRRVRAAAALGDGAALAEPDRGAGVRGTGAAAGDGVAR